MFGLQLYIGSAMVALTVVIHTVGIIGLIAIFRTFGSRFEDNPSYIALMRILVITIDVIFLIHTVEIWLWAVLYFWLGEFGSFERALYFSTVTFTTLGYGDITLHVRWQLLSGFEAANGIILFGVSTAFIFGAIRKLFEAAEIKKAENR